MDSYYPRILIWILFPVVMIAFGWLFIDSMWQLRDNFAHILQSDRTSRAVVLLEAPGDLNDVAGRLAFLAKGRIALEHDSMFNRQQRTSSALATRTWLRFMSLIFGTVLVINGSVFVLGRVTAPQADTSLQWQNVKISFVSSSPGLVLAFLGFLLIGLPNVAKQEIEVSDASAYMQEAEDASILRGGEAAVPPGAPERVRRELKQKSQ